MEETKFKTRFSLMDTLRFLPVNDKVEIPNHMAKEGSVRGAASLLQREGMLFKVDGKKRYDNVLVTRLK